MQRLVEFLVTNRLFAILLVAAIVLLAWARLPGLKISQYPNIDIPMLTANVYFPGASSRTMERGVVDRIEESLEGVRGIREINSRITNSYAQIAIEYERGTDIDVEYSDVFARFNNLAADLPDAVEIVLLKQNPTDRLVSFVLALSSTHLTTIERDELAENLRRRLRAIDGLTQVKLLSPKEEVRITLELAEAAHYGIGPEQIAATLEQGNRFLPTGVLDYGDKAVSIRAVSPGYEDLQEIRDTGIVTASGRSIRLADLAQVERVPRTGAIVTRVGNFPSTWLTMALEDQANVFRVREDMQAAIDAFEAGLDDGIAVHWLFDVEAGVDEKLSGLISNILLGVVILGGVLLIAIGWRSAFIVTSTLPVALFLSIVGLSLTGYGIQEISLAGFVIALGLIVDSGIVVTENAFKLRTYQGHDRQSAAIAGTASVLTPLMSSTVTTALAFAPIFLLDSVTGLFLHSFVVTIWLCLAASLVAAIAFAAMLLARIGTENEVPGLPTVPSMMNGLIPFRDGPFTRLLRLLIRQPLVLVPVVALALALAGFCASRLEVIVFPDSDEPYFTVTISADEDRSTAFMQKLTDDIEAIVNAEAAVTGCSSIVGATFPPVHTGVRWFPDARNVGTVFCGVDFRDSRRLNALTARISAAVAPLRVNGNIEVAAFVNGEGVDDYDVEVILRGADVDELAATANRLEAHLRSATLDGVAYLNNPARSDWYAVTVTFNEQAANALGVTRDSVDLLLVMLTHGLEVDDYRLPGGDTLPIVMKAALPQDDPLRVFDRIFVTSKRGEQIPLSAIVDVTFDADEFDIYHRNFEPEIVVGLNAVAGTPVSRLTDNVVAATQDFEPGAGVALEWGGELAVSGDAFGGAGRYAGIIALAIFAVFVLQFNSFMQPVIVFAAIPLSFVGGFILLWLTGQPLSFLAFVGLTALMGIVINNSILLVDEGNRIARTGEVADTTEIAVRAAAHRFMPIVLTTLTTIAGLAPMALGDSMFKPLAIVIIGGLTTSTVLTLICVPVLFARLTRAR